MKTEAIRDLGQAGRYLAQSLRLMVGLPSYDAYLAHMSAQHPGRTPMSYEEFFANRLRARYGRTGRAGVADSTLADRWSGRSPLHRDRGGGPWPVSHRACDRR
jgi:uncharacterized short protein YbdD (DUF466 family)